MILKRRKIKKSIFFILFYKLISPLTWLEYEPEFAACNPAERIAVNRYRCCMYVLNLVQSKMKLWKSLCTTYSLDKNYIDVLAEDPNKNDQFTFIAHCEKSKEDITKK